MIVKKSETKPTTAQMQNGQKQTVKLEFVTYSIKDDRDMAELHDRIVEGIEFIGQVPVEDRTYVTVRKVIPLKFQLHGGSLKNLPKK